MLFGTTSIALLSLFALAQAADKPKNGPWPFDVTTLAAPDGSITVKFVSLGATMTELWVPDKFGKSRDIILGYDDNTNLLLDPAHPVFNPIVGRYANRIKNGTFSIPITQNPQPDTPNVYHIPTNDHNGQVTLHGGIYGWDRHAWTMVSRSPTHVTYMHQDPEDQGFPGIVTSWVTHSVDDNGVLKTTVNASATAQTPIMVTQHVYWNLDAFQDNSSDILSHVLRVNSSRVIDVDGDGDPTGAFTNVTGTPFDFRTAQPIGSRWNQTIGLCSGTTGVCQGYDSCWIYDHNDTSSAGVSLWSTKSGIRLDIFTNQPAVQVYTSNSLNVPRKAIHGGPSQNYTEWSALAIEQEGYIDAINVPQWGVDQIYGPERDFQWTSTYQFSVIS